MFCVVLLSVFIVYAGAYSTCPMHVECIPGCVKLDEKGCKMCACGPMMFHPGAGYRGMPGGMLGGASFTPGTLGGGGMFGSIQGGSHGSGYHAVAPKEKPLKECTGTMLCMMTCKGHYSLSKEIGNNGCRSCTCPKEHTVVTQVVVSKPQPKPQPQPQPQPKPQPQKTTEFIVVPKPATHTDCTGTKLCMMTCRGKYILGEHGRDGCQSCACVPEPKPPVIVQTKPKEECHEQILCMLSCKHGYSLSSKCNDGCHGSCQKCTCIAPTPAPTPAPKRLECPKTIQCMLSCKDGYHIGAVGTDGCPTCACLAPPKQNIIIYEVKCPQALSCPRGCTVGYKCDRNGCPTCECIHPKVVGVLTVTEIHTSQALTCKAALTCTKSCNVGYKCGTDGCPTCGCLVEVHTGTHGNGQTVGNNNGPSAGPTDPSNTGVNTGQGTQGPSPSGVTTGKGPFTTDNMAGLVTGSSPFNIGNGGVNIGNGGQTSGNGRPISGNGGSITGNGGSISGSAGLGSGQGPFNTGAGGSANTGPFAVSGSTNVGNSLGNGATGKGPFSSGSSGGNGPFNVAGIGNSQIGALFGGTNNTGMTSPFTINNAAGANGLGGGNGPFNIGVNIGNTTGNEFTMGQINGGGMGSMHQISNFNNLHQTKPGSSGSNGPFSQIGGSGNKEPFAGIGNNWQSGSGNGKGWATGGTSGPFSNGKGSGTSSGQFHNLNGSGHGFSPSGPLKPSSQTGSVTGSTNGNQLGQAPGTGNGGPFTLSANTGGPAKNDSGLPLSPFAAAAGGKGQGSPFSQASGSTGGNQPGTGISSPFMTGITGMTGTTGMSGHDGNQHLTDGSGGNIEQNIGGYGTSPFNVNTGSGSLGGSGNFGPYAGNQIGSISTSGFGNNNAGTGSQQGGLMRPTPRPTPGGGSGSSSSLIDAIKDCPDVMNCMKNCASGYNLSTRPGQGCPVCACADGSGPVPSKENLIQEIADQPAGCVERFSCTVTCTQGFSCNKQGCPTCVCVGQAGVALSKPEPLHCAGKFTCSKSCQHGYTSGQDGCPTCACVTSVTNVRPVAPAPKPQPTTGVTTLINKCHVTVQCMTSCEHGYTLGSEGPDGCPRCTCINPTTSECHTTCEKKPAMTVHTCTAALSCMTSCTNGYTLSHTTDNNGCPTCACKQTTCYTGCTETHHEVVQLVATSGCTSGTCEKTCTDNCGSTGTGGTLLLTGGTGGGTMTSGGGATGGGGVGGAMGGASGGAGYGSGGGGAGMTGGQQCAPLPPDCHPYCIKYDVAHCRKCECDNNASRGYSG